MATDLEIVPAPPVEGSDAGSAVAPGNAVVLHDVSWKMYRRLRKLPESCNIRMTYDPRELAQEIVRQLGTVHETELICSFHDWVRDHAQPV